ncbi:carbohydrate-binding protein [Chitinophaga japonensis]|uniref:Putative secreted protein (Por secretion system target) n=1 Tax=Chitinophaga japonensis TaxID=104662 RepID=A0A562T6X4_CHIJA|nr:carbohydrate-binding protein [Chitinophaga japonensis]TWI89242.1 putative secreted protein (Por secretion system target) [Chitinophaga japonensis]
MRSIFTLLFLSTLLWNNQLFAQFRLIDDMEGNGPGSGQWIYNAGTNATGTVLFHEPNPAPSALNPSTHVAKFTKDTTCSPYMAAACTLPVPLDLSASSTFKMLVYSTVQEEVLFKLQPGSDYTQAVYLTYKVQQVNRWEEAVFNFTGINHRTDLNRITVQFIDGRRANGILYFDRILAPDPISINLTKINIPMGQEDGKAIEVKLYGDSFQPVLNPANWSTSPLPPGVTVGSILRVNDTTAHIILSGNSPANYSRTVFTLTVNGDELQNPEIPTYNATGSVVFDGNPAWTMIYNDEFDTDGLPDPAKWKVDPRPKGWTNSEEQVYTDTTHDNARVRNGHLVITGKKDFPTGNPDEPWSSARVISQGKMDFLYGKVEMRAKLPRARGSWPAFWLMPTHSSYGYWPSSGEIDIMEHVGNNFGKATCAVHTENKNWTNGGDLGGNEILPDLDTVYHVYGVEWWPDSLRFTHDGRAYYTYVNPHTDWRDWPFDKPFYVILNISIGGGLGGNIVDADWPDSMLVDYVRIYQKGLGTPVLDSVEILPAGVSVLPGKTQQFTAKMRDQNGHVLDSITPVWSITGNGNVITAGGLATINSSGVVTATATYDTVTLSGSVNVQARATNYKPVPARIEAEDYDNFNSSRPETTADTSGGLNMSYIGNQTWFEYDLDVPDSQAYRIRFRVAVNALSALTVIEDTTELATVQLPASGGWQKWITVTSAPIVLGQGQKTIRVQSNTGGWNFNWLEIVPASAHQVASVVIKPDSARVFTGETVQFNAWGYDADSNYIMLAPAPAWSVSGTGNQVSANGLLQADSVGQYTITATSGGLAGTAFAEVMTVPVFSRLEIMPDTVTVPLGASQQFTVKGYDQYGTPVPVRDTVYWSVSGSGNSISPDGLLTAGNTPGSFVIIARAGAISDTLEVVLAYTCTVNQRYEAESASSHASGPYKETTDDVDGGQHFAGITAGKWFAYSNLNVPSAGRYNIRLRVSTTAPAQIKIGHGGATFRIINVPSTNGEWQTISDTLTLPALSYTGVHAMSGSFRFNWFAIDNCAEASDEPVRIALTPDTAHLGAGDSYQFSATAYDAANQPVPVPSLVWGVGGANNTVDTTGLVTANATPGLYPVTASAAGLADTAWIMIYECSVNTRYEAESCAFRHSGPSLVATDDVSGAQHFTGLAAGHWFAYNTLNVPTAGLYRISFRVSSTAPAQVKVGHSSFNFGIIDIPSTGGQWQTITDTITLPALSYTGIHVVSGSFRFNWFTIDNCGTGGGQARSMLPALVQQEDAPGNEGDLKPGVYPNPTSGHILVVPGDHAYTLIKVFDIQGRLVLSWRMAPGEKRISKDISALPGGVYLLSLEGAHERKTMRIIKQ